MIPHFIAEVSGAEQDKSQVNVVMRQQTEDPGPGNTQDTNMFTRQFY